jgi:hypothetical protein
MAFGGGHLENVNYGSNELASLGRFHPITTSLLIFVRTNIQRPLGTSLLFVRFWCLIQVLLLSSVLGTRWDLGGVFFSNFVM